MNLPIKYAYFPKPVQQVVGELIPNKESIVSWLLAKPRLLGWRLDIHWLWSSSASLFGLDRTGSLVIVRIGIESGAAPNPFEKPAADIKRAAMNRSWSAAALRAKWLKHGYATSVGCYGCDYGSVDKCLKLRERSGNPFPVFFGLIACSRSEFDLSRKAGQSLASIQKHVGNERAGLRGINAIVGPTQMRVQCWTPRGF